MKDAQPFLNKEPRPQGGAKNVTPQRVTPRQRRVIRALSGGSLLREEVDRVAGASNGPQVIAELRHGLGIDIQMERVDRIDRDGRPCKPGLYRLTGSGRERIAELEAVLNG